MDTLNQDLFIEILLKIDICDLLNMCLSNKLIYKSCTNERLWQLRTTKDYNHLITEVPKPDHLCWRQFYAYLYENYARRANIWLDTKVVGNMWIGRHDVWGNIKRNLGQIIKEVTNHDILSSTIRFSVIGYVYRLYTVKTSDNIERLVGGIDMFKFESIDFKSMEVFSKQKPNSLNRDTKHYHDEGEYVLNSSDNASNEDGIQIIQLQDSSMNLVRLAQSIPSPISPFPLSSNNIG